MHTANTEQIDFRPDAAPAGTRSALEGARPVAGDNRGLLLRTYLNFTFIANGIFFIYMLRAYRNPRYAESLVDILAWALVANVISRTLLSRFFDESQRRHEILLAADAIVSLLPFLLFACLRTPTEHRLHYFGFCYATFVFLRCAILVSYAFVKSFSLRRTRLWVFLSTTLVCMTITPWVATVSWPNGDEPAYLLMMQSLFADHDFDLTNNYADRDYVRFFPASLAGLEGGYPIAARRDDSITAIGQDHHTVLNQHHREMPWHDIGEPVLLLPGYAIAGRMGATLELNIISALLALGIFELSLQLCGSRSKALWTWALFAFAAPLLLYSAELFTEAVGGCFALWAGLTALAALRNRRPQLLLAAGALAAALPWICIRYWMLAAPLLAVMGLYLLAEVKERGGMATMKDLGALSAPMVVSLVAFSWFDKVNYGMLLPNAGYLKLGASVQHFWMNVHIGLAGLLLDRTYGLIPIAPIYLLSLAGACRAFRSQRRVASLLLIPVIVYALFIAFSVFWYGAGAPPARMITASLGLLAPFAVLVIDGLPRWLVWFLSAWSWLVAYISCAVPLARWASLWDRNVSGVAELFRERWGINPMAIFPSVLRGSSRDLVLLGVWLGLITIAACWLVMRRALSDKDRFNVAERV